MAEPDALSRAGADLREGLLLDTALTLIADEGWLGLTMSGLARRAQVSLADLYRSHASRADILTSLIRRIDLESLEDAPEADHDGDMPRDRLFDAVLLRFEALEPYRDALRVLAAELPRDPLTLARIMPDIRRSLAWTLDAGGVDPTGVTGALRVRTLGYICYRTFRVWLDDDGQDLARTMADLDRRLRRSERLLGLARRHRGGGREARGKDHPTDEGMEGHSAASPAS